MKPRKMKNKLNSMDKLKNIFANDPELLEVLDNAVSRGYLNKNGVPTGKGEDRNLNSYGMYLATGRGTPKIIRPKFKKKG